MATAQQPILDHAINPSLITAYNVHRIQHSVQRLQPLIQCRIIVFAGLEAPWIRDQTRVINVLKLPKHGL